MRAVMLFVGLIALAVTFAGCGEPKKYSPGKDTVESFGDGTWSILRTGGGPNNPRKTHLHCSETQETLVRNIADWREDGDWVYAVGEDGMYAVLNFRTNFHATYKTVVESPAEYHAGLRKLQSK
jgi:hypothetical protein